MRMNKFATFATAVTWAVLPVVAGAESHAMAMDYSVGNVDELEFVQFGEGPLMVSVLSGDMANGPSTFLMKVPAGYEGIHHTHSANYRLFVIKGEGKHWTPDENMADAKTVTAGGWWFQPADEPHNDANVGDGEALVLVMFDGPVDFIPHE